jgi:hypothetical protein
MDGIGSLWHTSSSRHLHTDLSWICRGWATAVNEQRYPLAHLEDGAPSPHTRRSEFDPSFSEFASVKRLALFHYVTGSVEDYVMKNSRSGDEAEANEQRAFFEVIQRCAFCPHYHSTDNYSHA